MSRPERDARIEWIKLLAIFAVAFQHLIHAQELRIATRLTHGAVPAFAFLSVFFAVHAGLRAPDFWRWVWSRVVRLYGLFLVWNVIYFLLRMVSAGAGAPSTFGGFSASTFFLVGYDNALWFIPFILLANVCGFALGFGLRRWAMRMTRVVCWLLVGGAIGLAVSPWFGALKLDLVMLGLARKAVPAALIGMALGLLGSDLDKLSGRGGRWVIGYVVVFGLSCYALVAIGRETFWPETLVGLSGIGLALRLIPRTAVAINPEFTLFVFVAHSLFIHGLRKGGFFLGYDWEKAGVAMNLAGFGALIALLSVSYLMIRNNVAGDLALVRKRPRGARAALSE